MEHRRLIIVMGPSGAGKTTLARVLAEETGWPMIEGDDYHSLANKAKMASGTPLTDEDRIAWIDALCAATRAVTASNLLLACSALTSYVQERLLIETDRHVRWLLLNVPRQTLQDRLIARPDHFMPASQLNNQIATLSPPKDAIHLNASAPPERLAEAALKALNEKT